MQQVNQTKIQLLYYNITMQLWFTQSDSSLDGLWNERQT